jgi:hypothetical protein
MTEITPAESDAGGTVEVVVFAHGREVLRQPCESTEEAASIVEWWNEQDDTECRVDDLSIHHGPDDILEASLEVDDVDYSPDEDP